MRTGNHAGSETPLTMSNSQARAMSAKIRTLKAKAQAMLNDAERMKEEIRNAFGLGVHDGVTVFKVRATKVRAHTRRGYIGVCAWGQ